VEKLKGGYWFLSSSKIETHLEKKKGPGRAAQSLVKSRLEKKEERNGGNPFRRSVKRAKNISRRRETKSQGRDN